MVLFTSAVPGKKAAPKAPARRRPAPAPTGPPPSAQPEASTATPTPQPTQPPTITEDVPVSHEIPPAREPEQPISEPVREPEVEQTQPELESVKPVEPVTQPISGPECELVAEPVLEPEPLVEKEPSSQPEPMLPIPEPSQPTQSVAQESQPANEPVTVIESVVSATQDREREHATPQPETQASAPAVEDSPSRTLQEQRLEEFRQVTTAHVLEAAATAGVSKPAKRAAPETAPSSAPRPAKKVKRSSTRSNAKVTAVATTGEDVPAPDQDAGPAPPVSPAPRAKRAKKAAAESPTATRRSTRTKKATSKKSASTIVDSDDEMEGVEGTAPTEQQSGQDAEVQGGIIGDAAEAETAAPKRKPRAKAAPDPNNAKRGRKKRLPTIAEETERIEEEIEAQQDAADESDPELHEIDPNTLSMWDLSYDSKHGQMSERGKKMNEIDWDEVAAKRKLEANLIAAGDQTAPEGTAASTEATSGAKEGQAEGGAEAEQATAAESATPAPDTGDDIGFRMDEDGNIVEDESTLQVDRTAAAMAATVDKPVEDINDLTMQINRTSWINNNRREATDRVPLWKWKSDPWSEEETDRFYDALRMFGTDFLVISKMFPPKTRRMIKSKFTREEKLDPQRVTDALLGKQTVRMDLNHYARETSRDISVFTKYEGLEHAQAVINESMKERQEAMTTAVQQEAQLEAEKREKEKQKEKDKARRVRGKGKKAKVAGTFGGGGPEDGD